MWEERPREGVVFSVTELVQDRRTNRIETNVGLFPVLCRVKLITQIPSLRGRMVQWLVALAVRHNDSDSNPAPDTYQLCDNQYFGFLISKMRMTCQSHENAEEYEGVSSFKVFRLVQTYCKCLVNVTYYYYYYMIFVLQKIWST